jgi:hypothetical protein
MPERKRRRIAREEKATCNIFIPELVRLILEFITQEDLLKYRGVSKVWAELVKIQVCTFDFFIYLWDEKFGNSNIGTGLLKFNKEQTPAGFLKSSSSISNEPLDSGENLMRCFARAICWPYSATDAIDFTLQVDDAFVCECMGPSLIYHKKYYCMPVKHDGVTSLLVARSDIFDADFSYGNDSDEEEEENKKDGEECFVCEECHVSLECPKVNYDPSNESND